MYILPVVVVGKRVYICGISLVGDIRNYIIVYLFTARGGRLAKLMTCWNIVVFSGLTTYGKFGLFESTWS